MPLNSNNIKCTPVPTMTPVMKHLQAIQRIKTHCALKIQKSHYEKSPMSRTQKLELVCEYCSTILGNYHSMKYSMLMRRSNKPPTYQQFAVVARYTTEEAHYYFDKIESELVNRNRHPNQPENTTKFYPNDNGVLHMFFCPGWYDEMLRNFERHFRNQCNTHKSSIDTSQSSVLVDGIPPTPTQSSLSIQETPSFPFKKRPLMPTKKMPQCSSDDITFKKPYPKIPLSQTRNLNPSNTKKRDRDEDPESIVTTENTKKKVCASTTMKKVIGKYQNSPRKVSIDITESVSLVEHNAASALEWIKQNIKDVDEARARQHEIELLIDFWDGN